MSELFEFLSNRELEALGSKARVTYPSDAMEELNRAEVPQHVRGCDCLLASLESAPASKYRRSSCRVDSLARASDVRSSSTSFCASS